MIGAYIIGVVIMLISRLVSGKLQSKFRKYSQMQLQSNLSGKEVAEQMLADHGIEDVKVVSVKGQLTDHYNPTNKTVNLSEVVYGARNAASAAVASHEVGHAVQHATAYKWLTMRSKLVPVVSLSSKFVQWVIYAGIVLIGMFPQLLLVGIVMFALTTLFSLITLPVEYDASKRALAWIDSNGIVTKQEHNGAKDALKWAARTYVVAAIGSLGTLLYYIAYYMGRRN